MLTGVCRQSIGSCYPQEGTPLQAVETTVKQYISYSDSKTELEGTKLWIIQPVSLHAISLSNMKLFLHRRVA